MPVLVFTRKQTPRITYIFGLLLVDVLGVDAVAFTEDPEAFQAFSGPKINYSTLLLKGGLQCMPHNLLAESGISPQPISVTKHQGLPIFFQVENSVLPFDVFAAAFYLVSRYEEYLPYKADKHDRFTPSESLAYKHNFLELPVVNLWAGWLREALKTHFPQLEFSPKPYSFIPTVDVDNLFAYRGKGPKRIVGAALRDGLKLKLSEVANRAGAVVRIKKDPYNTFAMQNELHREAGLPNIYFMLFAEFAEFDRNLPMHSPLMKRKVRKMSKETTVAIHPSYRSNIDPAIVRYEKDALAKVIGQPVTQSRQHYLKMKLPDTFRNLVELGITDDYTMGYAAMPGFRASMATPYLFYDLEAETTLPLTMHPFMLMDVTFIDYLGVSPAMALPRMKKVADATRAVNGQLITVFHNRVFSEKEKAWKGWVNLYKEFLTYAKP
jgi:hypothetical protein